MPVFFIAICAILYLTYQLLETEQAFRPEQWHGLRKRDGPFFEGWYYKLVTPDRGGVVAVVPGVSLGPKGSRNDTHAFVFVTINGGETHYFRYPIAQFSAQQGTPRGGVRYRIGPNNFSDHGVELDLRPKAGDAARLALSGAVRFSRLVRWPVRWNSVGTMGGFGWLRVLQCYHHVVSMDHDLHGSLVAGRQTIQFTGGKGYADKDWGTRFPSDWIWLQCNHFEGHAGSSVFFSVARIPLYVTTVPGFVCGFWHQGLKRLYRFATYTGARVTRLDLTGPNVTVGLQDRHFSLVLRIRRSMEFAMMYGPRDGKMLQFIPETLKASVHATLTARRSGAVLFAALGRPAGLELVEEKPGGLQWLKRRLHA